MTITFQIKLDRHYFLTVKANLQFYAEWLQTVTVTIKTVFTHNRKEIYMSECFDAFV